MSKKLYWADARLYVEFVVEASSKDEAYEKAEGFANEKIYIEQGAKIKNYHEETDVAVVEAKDIENARKLVIQ